MTSQEAIAAVAEELTDELVICTTGHTCREMQAVKDRPANFYMIGSMGVAPAIGLGIALSRKDKTVVVFDGDGALLMGLGILPMMGCWKPKNLIHLVLDNEAFASTGHQPTYSDRIDLSELAQAAGYPVVRRVEDVKSLQEEWRLLRNRPGPSFLLAKCRSRTGEPPPRVRPSPEEITQRFMENLKGRDPVRTHS